MENQIEIILTLAPLALMLVMRIVGSVKNNQQAQDRVNLARVLKADVPKTARIPRNVQAQAYKRLFSLKKGLPRPLSIGTKNLRPTRSPSIQARKRRRQIWFQCRRLQRLESLIWLMLLYRRIKRLKNRHRSHSLQGFPRSSRRLSMRSFWDLPKGFHPNVNNPGDIYHSPPGS